MDTENKWIPIKWHNVTDKERQEENIPKQWATYFDCPMPHDADWIRIKTKTGNVEEDGCYVDIDGYVLNSGKSWENDIAAWMPLSESDQPNDKIIVPEPQDYDTFSW